MIKKESPVVGKYLDDINFSKTKEAKGKFKGRHTMKLHQCVTSYKFDGIAVDAQQFKLCFGFLKFLCAQSLIQVPVF